MSPVLNQCPGSSQVPLPLPPPAAGASPGKGAAAPVYPPKTVGPRTTTSPTAPVPGATSLSSSSTMRTCGSAARDREGTQDAEPAWGEQAKSGARTCHEVAQSKAERASREQACAMQRASNQPSSRAGLGSSPPCIPPWAGRAGQRCAPAQALPQARLLRPARQPTWRPGRPAAAQRWPARHSAPRPRCAPLPQAVAAALRAQRGRVPANAGAPVQQGVSPSGFVAPRARRGRRRCAACVPAAAAAGSC